jgi:hypothetical protein
MSRIFDAIQRARDSKTRNGSDAADSLGEMELPERRVAPRAELDIDLIVYGRSEGEGAFYEQAKAVRGNGNGGVFLLAIPVVEGQDLLLINNITSQEQICNVVGVLIRDIKTSEVSVSFPMPNPDFWSPTRTAGNL